MTLQVRTLEGCALVLVPGVATALTAGTPRWEWSSVAPFIVESFPLSLVWAAAFYYRDLRAAPLFGGYSRLIRRVLQSCSLAFALYLLVSLILEAATPIDSPAPRTFLLTLGMMGLLALPLNETTQVLLRRRGRRVLVFGQGALASQVLEELAKLPALYQTVVTVPADPAPSGGAQASHERLEHAISAHRPDTIIMNTTPNLQTDKWGLITADVRTGKTSRPDIYAGGDDVTGPSLVVTAMVAGRNAARAIDAYLNHS